MNVLDGVQNFLQFINDGWTSIIVIIGLLLSIAKKIKDLLNKSDEEKIAIAKKQIRETMLRLVTDAECDYDEWSKAGSIKRSQVIEEIFLTYPVLSKIANQEELVGWIDEVIDESLKTLREIIQQNTEESVITE